MSEPALKTELKPDRRPTSGTFELTIRCNLHCKMCLFRHDDSENAEIIAKEKSADEWIDMARQAAEAGTVELLITGGEPLIRADFPVIWEGLYQIGFVLTLYTNATLITPTIMAVLRKYPPHRIGVTLYGASKETYRNVTGNGKAYQLTLNGLKQLRTLPSEIDVRTTIIKDNLHDLRKMDEYISDEFGRDSTLTYSSMVFKPVRGGCADAGACRLEAEENIALYVERQYISAHKIAEKTGKRLKEVIFTNKNRNAGLTLQPRLTLFGCNAGMRSYAISWEGKMLGCQLLGQNHTDPFQTSFQQAWEDYPKTVELNPSPFICSKCELKDQCISCYASMQAEVGEKKEDPIYICQSTKQMAKFIKNEEIDSYENHV